MMTKGKLVALLAKLPDEAVVMVQSQKRGGLDSVHVSFVDEPKKHGSYDVFWSPSYWKPEHLDQMDERKRSRVTAILLSD